MLYSNNIEDMRKFFFDSWHKSINKESLSPLEQQIVEVIQEHPEYLSLFDQKEKFLQKNYLPELGETNPFLHLGLHLAIRDQIHLDRPPGIRDIYKRLMQKHGNSLTVEHLLMECLAECLWQAQSQKALPDEHAYIRSCKNLI